MSPALLDAIATFIGGGPGELEPLALALCRAQATHNRAYAGIVAGALPARLTDIPAVPVPLFRDLDLRAFAGPAAATFRTSGTTTGGAARGVHAMRDTRLYDLAATTHFAALLPDAPRRVVSLVSHAADSSLGHMVAAFADPLVPCFDADGLAPGTWAALDAPCLLAATAFALDALLAGPGEARLDARSVVMVTGGFKGRKVRLDAPSLYRDLVRLGSPRVVGEYGMTELSSQLWTRPVAAGQVPGPFVAPRWLFPYTVDPVSGETCGGVGLLRFVDLANVWSVLAIETLDLGEVRGDEVILHGRLTGADLRGCSLRAEDVMLAARGPERAEHGVPGETSRGRP